MRFVPRGCRDKRVGEEDAEISLGSLAKKLMHEKDPDGGCNFYNDVPIMWAGWSCFVYEKHRSPLGRSRRQVVCSAPAPERGDLCVDFLDKSWLPSSRNEDKNKHGRRCVMEIECDFHFRLKRKPKTKKVTVVIDEQ